VVPNQSRICERLPDNQRKYPRTTKFPAEYIKSSDNTSRNNLTTPVSGIGHGHSVDQSHRSSTCATNKHIRRALFVTERTDGNRNKQTQTNTGEKKTSKIHKNGSKKILLKDYIKHRIRSNKTINIEIFHTVNSR